MECTIPLTLVGVVSPIIPISLSETASDETPFAVYEMQSEEVGDKEGVYKIRSSVKITVVSLEFAQADTLSLRIASAVKDAFSRPPYSVRLTSVEKTSEEGIWTIEMNFNINQYL